MTFRYLLPFFCLTGMAAAENVSLPLADVLSRVTATEKTFLEDLSTYKPLVETYIQFVSAAGDTPGEITSDAYYIGNAEFRQGIDYQGFNPDKTFGSDILDFLKGSNKKPRLAPRNFAQMAIIDQENFNTDHYDFENPRGEFLGSVRCIVLDVKPKPKEPAGRFIGRIWVEDRNFHVVRFSGTYTSKRAGRSFHFNTYREQIGPGLWLPSIAYIEESAGTGSKPAAGLKGLVRFWSYASTGPQKSDTFTNIVIEAAQPPQDAPSELSRTEALRDWERQAEDNTIDRMEKAGLLGPTGDVEKVLDTVVNNLLVTNKLSVDPPIRTRVLLTTPLESFTVGHTLLVSRGLIDVLPNEASLAAVIARELSGILLGFKTNTMNAFSDRMLFEDQQIFRNFVFRRTAAEDVQANKKAMELLKNSPYAAQLPQVGLFLKSLVAKGDSVTNLTTARIGNPVADQGVAILLPELLAGAPKLDAKNPEQIAALPLVSRIRLDPWANNTEMIRAKAVPLLSANEKMPFEVMPVVLSLKRQDEPVTKTASAAK